MNKEFAMQISQKRLKTIFKNMKNKKVMVFGDIILDKYVWGHVSRISQEAPVPVLDVTRETLRLGGGANRTATKSSFE